MHAFVFYFQNLSQDTLLYQAWQNLKDTNVVVVFQVLFGLDLLIDWLNVLHDLNGVLHYLKLPTNQLHSLTPQSMKIMFS